MINIKLNIFYFFSSYRCYCIAREGRMLQRLINKKPGGEAYKSKVFDRNTYAINVLRSVARGRNAVLNKIFMDHVSDLTSTGMYTEEFEKYGISITECKITPNLKLLFVYWIHTKEINESEVSELLSNFGKHLNSELVSFAVINKPPTVRVVKDLDYMEEQRISSLLDTISIINKEETDINTPEKPKSNALPMQNKILGLDYCKILNNILEAKRASGGNTTHEITKGKIMGDPHFVKKMIVSQKLMQGKCKIQNLREIDYMPEDHPSRDNDDEDVVDDDDDNDDAIEESDFYNNNDNKYDK